MNPYQFEPYNAYSKTPRKKHWTEIAEEEELQARMLAEARAQQQTQANSVVGSAPAAGTGGAPGGAGAAGGGGSPPRGFFKPNVQMVFTNTPSVRSPAPVSVQFMNNSNSDTFNFCNYNWTFGDGTTSTDKAPNHTYSASVPGTGYVVAVTASSIYNPSLVSMTSTTFTASVPGITASFTSSAKIGPAPLTVTFTNLTTMNNGIGLTDMTFLWRLGSASYGPVTSTTQASSFSFTYTRAGIYTCSLGATGSYNIANGTTPTYIISASVT